MTPLEVTRPVGVGAPDRSLGRLGPALAWLAAAQGAWPPHAPATVRHLRLGGTGPRDGDPTDGNPTDGNPTDGNPTDGNPADGDLQAGFAQADDLADAGVDLVVLTATGDQVPGIVVAATLLYLEPVHAVGTVATADWVAVTTRVRDGMRAAMAHLGDPVGLLRAVASPDLTRATGLLAQCAVRRTPVLLDGSATVCAAALVAERLAPGGATWWLAGQAPPNPAAAQALTAVGLTPLLDLQLSLPLGADLALSVLLQAVEVVGG